MKKIKLNPEKLQLNKEKIANLTQEEMNNVNGGIEIALKKSKGNSRGCVCCPEDLNLEYNPMQ
jgi:hypothetical protein